MLYVAVHSWTTKSVRRHVLRYKTTTHFHFNASCIHSCSIPTFTEYNTHIYAYSGSLRILETDTVKYFVPIPTPSHPHSYCPHLRHCPCHRQDNRIIPLKAYQVHCIFVTHVIAADTNDIVVTSECHVLLTKNFTYWSVNLTSVKQRMQLSSTYYLSELDSPCIGKVVADAIRSLFASINLLTSDFSISIFSLPYPRYYREIFPIPAVTVILPCSPLPCQSLSHMINTYGPITVTLINQK